ncbi:MAG: hypothetical protein PHW76_01840 [Alphaproteobacteria bacterium]|nr:hypothetical protein [Alphaproteobacteria bacterium]
MPGNRFFTLLANDCPALQYVFTAEAFPNGLTFSRSSYATMFDSAGQLVWAPENLFYPSTIDASGTGLTKNNLVLGSSMTSPSGAVLRMVSDGTASGSHYFYMVDGHEVPFKGGAPYTLSAEIRADTARVIQLSLPAGRFGTNAYVNFDVTTGQYVSGSSVTSAGIIPLGSGVYRCWLSAPATSTGVVAAAAIILVNNNINSSRLPGYAGTGSGLYIGAIQTNPGALQEYHATTTAPFYGPRLDYDPATLQPRGLLIEESRTNILLNSSSLATQSVTVSAIPYTLSFYGTGSVTLSETSTGIINSSGAFPTRTTYTFTPSAGTLTLTVSGSVQYAQLEAGNFATSYIPTYASTAARAVENLYTTNLPWFNPLEGTFVSSVTQRGSPSGSIPASRTVCFSDGTSNNSIEHAFLPSGAHSAAIAAGGTISLSSSSIAAPVLGPTVKQGTAYKTGQNKTAMNGILDGGGYLSSSSIPSGINRLNLANSADGLSPLSGWIKSFKYWNRAFSAAELQKETT